MVKRVLLIAYHYPPQAGSSGVQRTLKFAQYLPEFGWEASVLTAHPRAYPRISHASEEEAGPAEVHRAFAFDSSRHLAFRGRYLQLTALPDRWVSWWLGAVLLGLRLAREKKFDVIWSTYPIATAHMIGNSLHRRTGIPWVADFRDPMTEPGFPPDPQMHRAYQRVERAAIAHCTRAVFTTPGTRNAYLRQFPEAASGRFSVIENGHDELDFSAAMRGLGAGPVRAAGQPFVLLHSGIVYPSERDPRPLFEALAQMRSEAAISARNFRLVLRASAHEAALQAMAERMGIADIVALLPPVPYREALAEMFAADGLLLLQASNCNNQIPAKMYEYVRAGRPIFALTDPAGDTAWALRRLGIDSIARLDTSAHIRQALTDFMRQVRQRQWPAVPEPLVQANSRRNRTAELARLLDEVATRNPP